MSKYALMTELLAREPAANYTIRVKTTESKVAILAPHAGKIEPGTGELATAIADASGYRLHCFEGHRRSENYSYLHVTSHRYDEPQGRQLVAPCGIVVAIHGCADRAEGEEIYLGGRDVGLREAIGRELRGAGFGVPPFAATPEEFKAQHRNNICNVGQSRAGAQLELSLSLRRSIDNERGERFSRLVNAIVRVIENHQPSA
jgi:phage replication-related protein YjqB (UPF0714/DUF867 family)